MPNYVDEENERRRPGGGLFGTAWGLDLGDDEDDASFFGRHRPDSFFSLSDGVGSGQANKPRDVAKVQALLGNWDNKLLERNQGPTGFLGTADEANIRDYQQRHGLRVDGYLRPGGQTIRSLRRGMRGPMQGNRAPTEQDVEDHHADLRAGGKGLIAWRQPLPKIGGDGAGLPAVADEDRFSLDRSIEHLAGYSDPGGFPSFQAGEISREGGPALARTRYLLSGLEKRNPETAGKFLARLLRYAPESWQQPLLGGPLPEPRPVGVLREKVNVDLEGTKNARLSAGTDEGPPPPPQSPQSGPEKDYDPGRDLREPDEAAGPDKSPDKPSAPQPEPTEKAPDHDGLVDRILEVEGTGKNSRSTSQGVGQFTDGTWKDMLARHRPDLIQGKSKLEINALKNDPALAREMAGQYIRENAAALQRNGWPPTAANQYLAYHFGAGGANALLRADGKRSGEDVLGEAVIRANPHLKEMSVGQIREWAAGRMNFPVRR